MTSIIDTFGGAVIATSFSGSGASLTNIPFTGLTTAAVNSAVWVDGSSLVVATGALPNTLGGTGVDSSGFTGLGKVAAGVWSASTLVNADVAAGAAIAFSKMEALAFLGVATTDGTGVITAAAGPLSRGLGGTGVDLSAAISQFKILATDGAANIIDTNLTYGTSAVANSLVQRDGTGVVALTSISVTTISAPGDITFSPVGGDILFETTITHWSASADADSYRQVATVNTADAVATTLLGIATTSGTAGRAYTLRALITCGSTSTSETASFSFLLKFKNILTTLTQSGLQQLSSAIDNALGVPQPVSVSVAVASQTLNIQVTGKGTQAIKWSGVFDIASQAF